MIPTPEQIHKLWDTYTFPQLKRIHVTWVSRTALFFADRLKEQGIEVDIHRLEAAALLHDIDKNIPKHPGEQHPDAGVRVLTDAGYTDIAALVRKHPLHAILDPELCPRTWEERLLYLADKMVKYEVISVDKRFALWEAEQLDDHARDILRRSYPKVKQLESEVLGLLRLTPQEVAKLVREQYT